MEYVEPKVYTLAYTAVDEGGMANFLDHVGAGDWTTDAPSGGEKLAEVCGRACYRSWKPGLNPNVTRVREGNRQYIGNILKQRHGSVIEHAYTTFAFCDVSRVFTHEFVRHRAGMAFSQESLRFVRLDELLAWSPTAFDIESVSELYDELQKAGVLPLDGRAKEEWVRERVEYLQSAFQDTFSQLEGVQQDIASQLYLDQLSGSFGVKKRITSAMRRLAPIGLATMIIGTGNHRAWRHQIAVRTAKGAEEEVRLVFSQVAEILLDRYPNFYQDMKQLEDGSYWFANDKI